MRGAVIDIDGDPRISGFSRQAARAQARSPFWCPALRPARPERT